MSQELPLETAAAKCELNSVELTAGRREHRTLSSAEGGSQALLKMKIAGKSLQ